MFPCVFCFLWNYWKFSYIDWKKLNEKYNNIFQENFVRQILSQPVKKGAIINNRGKFIVDNNEIEKYTIPMESFDYDFGLLVDSFIEYANKNCFFLRKTK